MRRIDWRELNSLVLLTFSLVFVALQAAGAPAAGTPAGINAHETIQNATDHLLQKLAEVKHLYAKEPLRVYYEVESAIVPYIDLNRFSRRVMAKYYRNATAAQKEEFKLVFKDGLIKTYAKALVEFDNERIAILPPRKGKPKRADQAVVKMVVHSKNGTLYPVDYTTALTDGQWKLINVKVNGINLGLQFRDKFRQDMAAQKGDIDKVIDGWNPEAKAE
ncbi:MAG: ABC transporter substrate-binding protein [Pseudomonadales bacterium]|jgi:phospholipid transport system substrate-binding protein|nr:ABC transporter substrate-binding protein [Pseudomonadales bacterium]MDP7357168.1 ABC transporter substrate-binding protein [Pseudomonadales bacterium]MDP7594769.1 ABC transporter substrate-binding protein [Pseudomonadales bacterium]HJN50052.1 ABC transporter substrate-binding protein [Pseudomonadales bacterium]|tara:strand:+ start:19965 stop:20621 length:657 start_codon:yes stop_codon:yes gene_type:complete